MEIDKETYKEELGNLKTIINEGKAEDLLELKTTFDRHYIFAVGGPHREIKLSYMKHDGKKYLLHGTYVYGNWTEHLEIPLTDEEIETFIGRLGIDEFDN